jgi:PKD repeat protein
MLRAGALLAVLAVSVLTAGESRAASDSRFFGSYCGNARVHGCVTYQVCTIFGWPCYQTTICRDVDITNIRAQVLYREPQPQSGVLEGNAHAEFKGKQVVANFSGVVQSLGHARGVVSSNYFDPNFGSLALSSDGHVLTINARGKSILLSKDACGNTPPRVSINLPHDGDVIPFGSMQLFSAAVSDAEDATIPAERLRFVSDRDGLIGNGQVVFSNRLSPGVHAITFSATDGGGLTSMARVHVTVENRPPDTPVIVRPDPADLIVATGPVALEGKAFDREQGALDGNALVWTSVFGGGAPVFRGNGRRVTTTFTDPGTYTLRLTARDNLGAESFSERTITVLPFGGNTPPLVSIQMPDPLGNPTDVAAILFAGTANFVGFASDLEDQFPALDLRWRAEPVNPPGPAFEFGAGTTAPSVDLSAASGDTTYRVTFSAKDSGGLTGASTIKLLVLPGPIQ